MAALLLPFKDIDTNFIDYSANNHTITGYGQTTQITAQSKWYGRSAYFDGSGDYIEVPDHPSFNFGSVDFTIEFWIRWMSLPTGATSYASLVSKRASSTSNNSFGCWYGGTDKYMWTYSTNGTTQVNITGFSSSTPTTNVWYHIAFVRSGNNLDLYIDGVKQTTQPFNVTLFDSTVNLRVGDSQPSGYPLHGFLQDLRIIKGTALYTANFTPPNALYPYPGSLFLPFKDLGLKFIDYSANNQGVVYYGNATLTTAQSKWYDRSAYFDGSSHLEITNTSNLYLASSASTTAVGTPDFTVESWVYYTGTQTYGLYCFGAPGSTSGSTSANRGGLYILVNNDGRVHIIAGNLSTDGWGGFLHRFSNSSAPTTGWSHVAVVSVDNTPRIFINGVESALSFGNGSSSVTSFATLKLYSPRKLCIMATARYDGALDTTMADSTTWGLGYLQDLRITTGTALYTANFTPPNALYPYPGALLLPFKDIGTFFKDYSDNNHTITRYGDATQTTAQSKWYGLCAYFDGSGDYLQSNHSSFQLGTVDFTIEMWINLDIAAMGDWVSLIQIGTDTTNGVFGLVRYSNSNPMGIRVDYYNNSWFSSLDVVDAGIQPNTWHHIALTRQSGAFRFFVDGVLKGENTITIDYFQQNLTIGARSNGLTPIKGYLQDLRITKGKALYTANFNVPLALLYYNDINNYSLLLSESMMIWSLGIPGIITHIYKNENAPQTITGYGWNLSFGGVYSINTDISSSFRLTDGGSAFITGTLTYNGAPAQRKVRLHRVRDGLLVETQWSDPITGVYTFSYVDPNVEYYVWADDYQKLISPVSHRLEDQSNIAFTLQVNNDPDNYAGLGKIWGNVNNAEQEPMSRRLVLVESLTYIIVGTTMSDPTTGYYEFDNLNTSITYTIIAEDETPHKYNDIIRARVTAEVV